MPTRTKFVALVAFVAAMWALWRLVRPGTDATTAPDEAPAGPPRLTGARRRFLVLTGVATLLVTAAVYVASRRANHGVFAYVIDDTAIHLSMARQLAENGTWGVSSGVYASASSSPGWTLLLAAFTWLLPSAATLLPVALNLLAGGAILWLFARHQEFLLPTAGRAPSVVLTVAAPVILWFLPGLSIVGMEHGVHSALVLAALILFVKLQRRPLQPADCGPYLVVLFLAGLMRYETMFVAMGAGLAMVLASSTRLRPEDPARAPTLAGSLAFAAASIGVAALPIVGYGIANLAHGHGFLPDSILGKLALRSRGTGGSVLPGPIRSMEALAKDQMLLASVLVLTAYLVWAWYGTRRAHTGLAVTVLSAILLHGAFAEFHYYERYQAYLVIGASFALLLIASELATPQRLKPLLVLAAVSVVMLSTVRTTLTFAVPLASSNTYRQRYQMALFFRDFYRGRPIATGELGYASLFHEGPIVDLLGLGTHEVVQELRKGPLSEDYVRDLINRHGVSVIGMYGLTRDHVNVPRDWALVGEWVLHEPRVTTIDKTLLFYAPSPETARELDRNLHRFDARLPDRVESIHHPVPA